MLNEIGRWVLLIIGIVAILAILYIFITYSGLPIPPIVINIFWIIVVALLCAGAVKLFLRIFNN